MDAIVIEGVKPYDGRYDFDLSASKFTTHEWGWIKRFSGYLPTTLDEGWRAVDAELFCTFAVIAMRRAGHIDMKEVPDAYNRLAEAEFAKTIRFDLDAADEEEAAPADPTESSSGNGSTSGPDSLTSSASWGSDPKPTGTPASVISVSGLERSAS